MEAALADLSIEDVKDEADDRDYIIFRGEYAHHIPHTLSLRIVADEEDVFESDFESTDEEAETALQTADAGDRQVKAEERKEKKVDFPKISSNSLTYHPTQAAQNRIERAAALAHARQKVTFKPETYDDVLEETSSMVVKKKRRVSIGLAIDAETGEVINNAQRQSRRSHTILNTSATARRMKKDAEDKKVRL